MTKCDICGKEIKGEIAKSFGNYHFLCFKQWAEGKGASTYDETKGEYVENSKYE